ncbi:MAG: hypothetical protein ACNA8R_05155 [Nitriliruptoraceae bacterium]
MLWLIVGILVGAGVLMAVQYSRREEVSVPWYSWLLGVVAVVFVLIGIEVFAGSMVESEPRAAWLGLAAFAVPGVIVGGLAVWLSGRRSGERDAGSPAGTVEHASA